MTKKKCTKRSLIFSVLAMLLCVSMLVGTTFAWFTDSVTSVKNKIVAGNLDVALYWSTDASTWAPVSGATNVFKEGTLWEPGHTEVVYLKVVNEGTLALKYQLGVNVFSETAGVNVAGDEFLLSNYIKFAALEDVDTAFADRAAAKAAAAAAAIPLTAGFAKASALETTDSAEYVALVVYMPETVGNEANYRGTAPQINLGINLVATQMTYEADSYDNQYDADANFSVWNGTVPAELPDTLTVDPATRTITVGDAAAFAYLHSLDEAWAGLYSASGNGADWTDYKDGKGADYYYHWEWDVVLASDIDLANQPWTPVDLSYFSAFDGKGYTVKNVNVTATANYAGLFSQVSAGISNLKVDGVVIDAAAYTHVGAVAGNSNGVISNVTVTDAIVTGNKYVGGIIGYGYASITSSTVADSVIAIPTGGQKEAGGLAGYLCAGDLATDTKDVNGNVVRDTVISAPTVASALVSHPNGLITIDFNTVANVTVSTEDDTADIFVSNNVGGKSIVVNNTESGCTVNKSATLPTVTIK